MEGSRETTRVNGERSLPRFHTTLRATLQHPSQRSAQSRRRKGAVVGRFEVRLRGFFD